MLCAPVWRATLCRRTRSTSFDTPNGGVGACVHRVRAASCNRHLDAHRRARAPVPPPFARGGPAYRRTIGKSRYQPGECCATEKGDVTPARVCRAILGLGVLRAFVGVWRVGITKAARLPVGGVNACSVRLNGVPLCLYSHGPHPQETRLSQSQKCRWRVAYLMALASCSTHGNGTVSRSKAPGPAPCKREQGACAQLCTHKHNGRAASHGKVSVPTPLALHFAEGAPFQYLRGIGMVTLQPYIDMGIEIGQTAAPPVGLPTLASTYYSERAAPVVAFVPNKDLPQWQRCCRCRRRCNCCPPAGRAAQCLARRDCR